MLAYQAADVLPYFRSLVAKPKTLTGSEIAWAILWTALAKTERLDATVLVLPLPPDGACPGGPMPHQLIHC